MDKPLISIITVVYNDAKGISKTIESILGQSYTDIEHIIIDGNSTDGTKTVLNNYRTSISKIVSEPDNGIYDAMNKGIRLAKGHLIGIINSGDFLEQECVAQVVDAYKANCDFDIFHGILRVFTPEGSFKCITGNSSTFLSTGMIEHPTCFVKKDVYQRFGLFDTAYKSSADYEFMLRVLGKGATFKFLEYILVNFYEGGISSKPIALLETLAIRQKYNLISKARKIIMSGITRLKYALMK